MIRRPHQVKIVMVRASPPHPDPPGDPPPTQLAFTLTVPAVDVVDAAAQARLILAALTSGTWTPMVIGYPTRVPYRPPLFANPGPAFWMAVAAIAGGLAAAAVAACWLQ